MQTISNSHSEASASPTLSPSLNRGPSLSSLPTIVHPTLRRHGAFSELAGTPHPTTAVRTRNGYVLRSPFIGRLKVSPPSDEASENAFFEGPSDVSSTSAVKSLQPYKLRSPRGIDFSRYRKCAPSSPSPLRVFSPSQLEVKSVVPNKRRSDAADFEECSESRLKRERLEGSVSSSPTSHDDNLVVADSTPSNLRKTYVLDIRRDNENKPDNDDVRIFELRAPTIFDEISFNICGDAIETLAIELDVDVPCKVFHTLDVDSDVDVREADPNELNHQAQAAKVLGHIGSDSGLTLAEFEVFCTRCKNCKLYSSRRSFELFHAASCTGYFPEMVASSSTALLSPLSSNDVQALYDRFHAVRDSTGITREELESLFVICPDCDRILVRTATVTHKESTGHDSESSPLPTSRFKFKKY